MAILNGFFSAVNNIMSNYVLLFVLCGTGLYFTLRLGFIQVRGFGEGWRRTFGGLFAKNKDMKNGISSYQALSAAIAAQVGTGNLAGAATAIAAGGPGAIFWMWVSAFLGMATIYAEAVMAQKHKVTVDGQTSGGPVYYIRAAFTGKGGKILAAIFAVLLVLALGFMGNMVQSNSIGDAFATAFHVNPLIVGVVIALISFFVFAGGVHRIVSLTEKIVPVMAAFYIIGALIVIFSNASHILPAFRNIFVGAFAPQAVAGGVLGATVQKAMRYGVGRGLFSNEAGMGSTPHAHAIAKVDHPSQQGFVAIIGVFIDTFVILTLTALVILTSGTLLPDGSLTGTALTQASFNSVFGSFGSIFIAICMFFFAFSTIIGWYFFGEANIRYLWGKKAVKPYALLVSIFIVIGSALRVDLVWTLADTFNAFMVVPNLLALLALSGSIAAINKDYYHNFKKKNK